jgi:hypothetical protein
MERRHLLLVAMAAAAGLGAAGAAAIVAADDDRVAAGAVTVTLAQTTTQIATQEAPPEPVTEPATTEQTGVEVPPLLGLRLDEATTALDDAGLAREVDGGGLFGVLDDTQWFVCDTTPTAGVPVEEGSVVVVHVERDCLG